MLPGWVESYIGIPFQAGGRDRGGIDCLGIYRLTLGEQTGVWLPTFLEPHMTAYEQAEIRAHLLRLQPRVDRIPAGGEHLFDAIFLSHSGGRLHMGMVLGDRRMLTVEKHFGVVIDRYDSSRWQRRTEGFARWKP